MVCVALLSNNLMETNKLRIVTHTCALFTIPDFTFMSAFFYNIVFNSYKYCRLYNFKYTYFDERKMCHFYALGQSNK